MQTEGSLGERGQRKGGEGMQFIVHESFVSRSVVCKDAVLTVPESWDLNAELQGLPKTYWIESSSQRNPGELYAY